MEPVTVAVVGKLLWEYFGEPVLDSAKTQFGDKILDGLDKLKFKKEEIEIIEAELVTDQTLFSDEEHLIAYMKKNEKINEVLKQLNKRETNITINVKKGVGYIEKAGDINIS